MAIETFNGHFRLRLNEDDNKDDDSEDEKEDLVHDIQKNWVSLFESSEKE